MGLFAVTVFIECREAIQDLYGYATHTWRRCRRPGSVVVYRGIPVPHMKVGLTRVEMTLLNGVRVLQRPIVLRSPVLAHADSGRIERMSWMVSRSANLLVCREQIEEMVRPFIDPSAQTGLFLAYEDVDDLNTRITLHGMFADHTDLDALHARVSFRLSPPGIRLVKGARNVA